MATKRELQRHYKSPPHSNKPKFAQLNKVAEKDDITSPFRKNPRQNSPAKALSQTFCVEKTEEREDTSTETRYVTFNADDRRKAPDVDQINITFTNLGINRSEKQVGDENVAPVPFRLEESVSRNQLAERDLEGAKESPEVHAKERDVTTVEDLMATIDDLPFCGTPRGDAGVSRRSKRLSLVRGRRSTLNATVLPDELQARENQSDQNEQELRAKLERAARKVKEEVDGLETVLAELSAERQGWQRLRISAQQQRQMCSKNIAELKGSRSDDISRQKLQLQRDWGNKVDQQARKVMLENRNAEERMELLLREEEALTKLTNEFAAAHDSPESFEDMVDALAAISRRKLKSACD